MPTRIREDRLIARAERPAPGAGIALPSLIVGLFAACAALALAGWYVDGLLSSSQTYQRAVRTALIERTRALRFQLDEQYGVRDYVATGDPRRLEPYRTGRRELQATLRALADTLRSLGLDDDRFAEAQWRRNAAWLAAVAEPLVRGHVSAAEERRLELRGARLVNAYREADLRLIARLDAAADAADRRSRDALVAVFAYLVGTLALVAGLGVLISVSRARAAREALDAYVALETQKRIADSLQQAFLNPGLPAPATLAFDALYRPASVDTRVGGDWYDAFELEDGRVLFSIGDVAGHGLDAAVVMARARQAIIGAACGGKDPATALQRANQSIMLQSPRLVTAICGYVNPGTFEITYATAGHPLPILVERGATARFIEQSGIPLGIKADAAYRTFHVTASDGALLVLYTDGLIENRRDILDGETRLLAAANAVAASAAADPASAIGRIVFAEYPPLDDVAILTIAFRRAANDLRLEPSPPDALQAGSLP